MVLVGESRVTLKSPNAGFPRQCLLVPCGVGQLLARLPTCLQQQESQERGIEDPISGSE